MTNLGNLLASRVLGIAASLLLYAFLAFLAGMAALFLIFDFSIAKWSTAAEVAQVVSAVGGIVGTLVGAFIGFLSGASGKELAHAQRLIAEVRLEKALGLLSPDQIKQVMQAPRD